MVAKRAKNYINKSSTGPFEAIVVNHLDPHYMGTLQVELLKQTASGNQPERTGQMVEARYLSPFYGVTPLTATSNNEGYKHSQKSYGFWGIPPDVGTTVLVILVEENLSKAFWIGCVQEENMNFMLPGYAGTDNLADFGSRAPATEYNKRLNSVKLKDATKYRKPVHGDLARSLIQQGLLQDDIRGITTSSARREVPSAVFGISTGGPLDKRPNAPKDGLGPFGTKASIHTHRLGGSSFVMDDGDDKFIRKGKAEDSPMEYVNLEAAEEGGDPTLPANELLRLRTRTGHQLLMHNTEDLIYIGNAKGTAWIELTSNGKIDIYAADSISVHTQVDLNFTADRDINFTAGKNLNMVVGKDIKATTGSNMNFVAGANALWNVGDAYEIAAGENITQHAEGNSTYSSTENANFLSADNVFIGSAGANVNIDAFNNFHLNADKEGHIHLGTDLHIQSKGETDIKSTGEMAVQSTASMRIHSENTLDILGAEATKISSTTSLDINGGSTIKATAGQIDLNSDGAIASLAAAGQAEGATVPVAPTPTAPEPPTLADQASRIPQHEPWYEHEHLNPALYTPEKTVANTHQEQTYVPRISDTFAKQIGVPVFGQPTPKLEPKINDAGDVGVSSSGTYVDPGTTQNEYGGQFGEYDTVDRRKTGTRNATGAPITGDKRERGRILASRMRAAGFTDDETLLSIIAVCNTESNLLPAEEASYGNNTNSYIRSIFKTATRGVSEGALTSAKATKTSFFELVYGNNNKKGLELGNQFDGDGGNYIGRGIIQLTGRDNYERFGKKAGLIDETLKDGPPGSGIGLETNKNPFGITILDNPDLLKTDYVTSCDIAAQYLLERYKPNRGKGILGDLRLCINPGGFDHAYPKDLAFRKKIDSSWLEEPKAEQTANISKNVQDAGGVQERRKGPF
jgi:uncharacterized protein (DUF2345 family)